MSWRVQVKTKEDRGWVSNGLVYATKEEAEADRNDLLRRWFAVIDSRIVKTDEEVRYVYRDGRAWPVERT